VRGVCVTRTWYGKSCGDGPTRRRRCSVSSIHQQRGGAEPSRPDHRGQSGGKRPLVVDPSPAEALPTESSQAPKRRRLIRITDDDDEEEEAAPSLVQRSRSCPNVAPITGDRATSDPPAPLTEPTHLGATEAAAAAGRTRRTVFTATHRCSDL